MDRTAQMIFFTNVEALRNKTGKTQAEVAKELGYRNTHLNAIWCCRKPLSSGMANRIAKYFATDLSVLYSPPNGIGATAGASSEYQPVPLVAYRSGNGTAGEKKQLKARVVAFFAFKEDWLQTKGNSENMAVVALRGEQAGGLVPDGALVLIDESQTTLVNGKTYLIGLNGDVRLIRYAADKDTPLAQEEEAHVIGKAIWYGIEF